MIAPIAPKTATDVDPSGKNIYITTQSQVKSDCASAQTNKTFAIDKSNRKIYDLDETG